MSARGVGGLQPRPRTHPDDVDAEACYLDALAVDLSHWPWPKARLELAYGIWLRRQRRVSEARSPLRSAQLTLDLVGATRWADQARQELLATGEHHPDARSDAHDRLSAQELEIALLAADGLTNREIGQRLLLSPRTVGSHLARVFPKLAITSRSQLARRLHRP